MDGNESTLQTAIGWNHIGKYCGIIRVSLLNKLAYTGDVLARTGFMVMVLFIFAQLWQRALPGGNTLAGFNEAQMVWYLLVTESITLSSPHVETAITNDVKSGNIAYQLIRPYSYVGYYLSLSMGEFLVRWPANFTLGALVAWLMIGAPSVQWQAVALALLATCLGACLSFLFVIALALTAFWCEENRPFFWIYSKMIFTLGGLFVPTEVYPGAVRAIAHWSPFAYMVSAPARLFVRFEWSFWRQVLLGQMLWLLVLSLTVHAIYQAGVKRVHVQGG